MLANLIVSYIIPVAGDPAFFHGLTVPDGVGHAGGEGLLGGVGRPLAQDQDGKSEHRGSGQLPQGHLLQGERRRDTRQGALRDGEYNYY